MRDFFLKTKRTGFSVWSKEDSLLAKQIWGQPEVTAFISANGLFTDQEIKNRLNQEINHYQDYQVQYFPVFDLNTNDLIGCCGLRRTQEGVYELGYHLRKEYWGQGLATEMAEAIIHYASTQLEINQFAAGHHPLNEGSKKVLSKLGFSYVKDNFYEPTGLNHPSYLLNK